MKKLLLFLSALTLSALISGCGLICQAGTGTCGMSREQVQKLLYPKTYGENFVKPDITKEGWREDWVACGGRSNGAYTPDPRLPGETDDFAGVERKTAQLDACMKSKGYEFRREP